MDRRRHVIFAVGGTLLSIVIVIGLFWGIPRYDIYSKRLSGEASLQKAQYDRQIAVAEAHAKVNHPALKGGA